MKKLKLSKLALRTETVAHLRALPTTELVKAKGAGVAPPLSDTRGHCTTREIDTADCM